MWNQIKVWLYLKPIIAPFCCQVVPCTSLATAISSHMMRPSIEMPAPTEAAAAVQLSLQHANTSTGGLSANGSCSGPATSALCIRLLTSPNPLSKNVHDPWHRFRQALCADSLHCVRNTQDSGKRSCGHQNTHPQGWTIGVLRTHESRTPPPATTNHCLRACRSGREWLHDKLSRQGNA